jgi:glycosyltransferase involved in cell wall biosynthesis/2-polyprenyl-3-methyl-5-hydroxy-6-metoxy-1,4-benzoquinol methylase
LTPNIPALNKNPACWCGNTDLAPFSKDYLRCPVCETLVLAQMPTQQELLVADDDQDFYGKHYFERMTRDHGLPTLGERTRADLPERCLHWLRGLLKYKLPPARVLELGSAHGGFVAMLRWAGFDATGLDLSPGLVTLARETFNVPILTGPIESQDIAPQSLDVIVLMDVLEHLGDPLSTIDHCLRLLKLDGVFFLQTPQYREGKSLEQMEHDDDPFMQMLKPDQHVYLFSKSSVKVLFSKLGVNHFNFEPAIFSFYDMALTSSRCPLALYPEHEIVASLASHAGGRMTLALLDLDDKLKELNTRHVETEAALSSQTKAIEHLQRSYFESEADRAARLENIHYLEKQLIESQTQLAAKQEVLNIQSAYLAESNNSRQNLASQCEALQVRLTESETDRAARLENMHSLEKLLAESQTQLTNMRGVVDLQSTRLAELDRSRTDLARQCQALEQRIAESTRLKESLVSARLAAESRRDTLARLLDRVHHSYVFRFMRSIGLWKWLAPEPKKKSLKPATSVKPDKALRRVVIDLLPVLPGGENGGAKVMTLELIQYLSQMAPNCEFTLLTYARSHDELAPLDCRNVRRICLGQPGDGAPSGSLLRELNADLLFCPFTLPIVFDPKVPVVSVVYDLQYLYYPQFFESREIQERDQSFRKACAVASKIVCISQYTRETVLDNSKLPPERLEIIPIVVPRRFKEISRASKENLLVSLNLTPERYLLYPANFWLHKNHEMLLTAFGMYLAAYPGSDLKLVLPGAPTPRGEQLMEATRRMGLSGAVVFPGYLRNEMTVLLESCAAVIFPSLFEGFGMPLLEAMAAGKPLLVSNATSLPEVAGDAALFFDPRNPNDIVNAITRLETDPKLRINLAEKSSQRLNAFGGTDEMADRYLKLFDEVIRHPVYPSPAVYGAFEDGWLGESAQVAVGNGNQPRNLSMDFTLPSWVPIDSVSVRLQCDGDVPQDYSLPRGERVTVSCPLASDSGLIDVSCTPVFQPINWGLGEDRRSLACHLESAQIIGADGEVVQLTSQGNVV